MASDTTIGEGLALSPYQELLKKTEALRQELHIAKLDRNTYDSAHKQEAAAALRARAENEKLRELLRDIVDHPNVLRLPRDYSPAVKDLHSRIDAALAIGPAQERPAPHPEWTVCPRCDNKIAHCDCAHPAPPQTPMTDLQCSTLRHSYPFECSWSEFIRIISAVEAFHGIK